MTRKTLLASAIAGCFFGVCQAWIAGIGAGVFQGFFMALAFAVILSWLPKSKWLKHQTRFPEELLLPEETLVESHLANLVIEPKQHGLREMGFSKWFWLFGMKGRESIGGSLHLTSHRLFFRSHGINRVTGHTSLFLSTIRDIENRSVFIVEKLLIRTEDTEVEFFVNEPAKLQSLIQGAVEQISDEMTEHVRQTLSQSPELATQTLTAGGSMGRWVSRFGWLSTTVEKCSYATQPFQALGKRLLEEFLGEPITETVDQWFRDHETRLAIQRKEDQSRANQRRVDPRKTDRAA